MSYCTKVMPVNDKFASALSVAALLMAAGVGPAQAAPVAVDVSAFSGTLIDFNALADRFVVGNQFAGLGVSVTGGSLITNNSSTVQGQFGSQGASNYDYLSPGTPSFAIVLTFSNPIVRIGMDQVSNSVDFILDVSGEEMLFGSSASRSFVGVEDLDGFTQATLRITAENDPLFTIDNLRFDFAGTPGGGTVPEPGGLALAALALGAAGVAGRRKARPPRTPGR